MPRTSETSDIALVRAGASASGLMGQETANIQYSGKPQDIGDVISGEAAD
jgi:hypothetical protein